MKPSQAVPPCLFSIGVTTCILSISATFILLYLACQEEEEQTAKALFVTGSGIGIVGTLIGVSALFYSKVVAAKQEIYRQASFERKLEPKETTKLLPEEDGRTIIDPVTGYTDASRLK